MTSLDVRESFFKTLKAFGQFLPIIGGVILLVGLSLAAVPQTFYANFFTGNKITDPLIGASLGSLASGNPITSYIISGELLNQGVSLLAVTAFIFAWVSVGLIQLPAESLMLGKKFAVVRNALSFISALIIAILTIVTLSLV